LEKPPSENVSPATTSARPRRTSGGNKNSGIVWSEATFKEYLQNPQDKIPGTKMILSVKNEKELMDLWGYLKQFGADGKRKSQ
jgi:cytochrome c